MSSLKRYKIIFEITGFVLVFVLIVFAFVFSMNHKNDLTGNVIQEHNLRNLIPFLGWLLLSVSVLIAIAIGYAIKHIEPQEKEPYEEEVDMDFGLTKL